VFTVSAVCPQLPLRHRCCICAPQELGTSGNLDGQQRLIVKGRFLPKGFENVIRRYMNEYVLCASCKSPDTLLDRDAGKNSLHHTRVRHPAHVSLLVTQNAGCHGLSSCTGCAPCRHAYHVSAVPAVRRIADSGSHQGQWMPTSISAVLLAANQRILQQPNAYYIFACNTLHVSCAAGRFRGQNNTEAKGLSCRQERRACCPVDVGGESFL
jgi:Domain found in IF2B/IF5